MTDDAIDLNTLVLGCESEKLHLSGAIQSFGALIVVAAVPPYRISHVSANLADFLAVELPDLPGRPIEHLGWLNERAFHRLGDQPGLTLQLPRIAECDGRLFDATLIRGQDAILIELEASESGGHPIALQELQKPFLSLPGSDEGVAYYHETLAETIQRISGYDRVMIYRFHDDWSGEVVAEACTDALGSYLGLRFPASDIPAIARNLYLINPYRLIPDIGAAPAALLGQDDQPPDLTWSNLRSVSPVHLQYLANMGVGASFSLPIVITGRLWGLVACHHLTPLSLGNEQRHACVAISRAYTLGITSYYASRRLQLIDSLERRVDAILEVFTHHADPFDGIEDAAPAIMAALHAHGLAMAIGDEVVIVGSAPDMAGVSLIDNWFMSAKEENLFLHDRLSSLFPDQPEIATVSSGILAIKARSPRRGWLRFYWFRDAEPHEVVWAGTPNKPMVENRGVPMLSPRRSFEKWVEIKTDHSRPWSNEDRMVASKIRNTLLRWL
jgi:chemotaxis family two-component system sensor kinase Cph1